MSQPSGALCPICQRVPIVGFAKTCGNGPCVTEMREHTRAESLRRERAKLYGEENPWVKWEREHAK